MNEPDFYQIGLQRIDKFNQEKAARQAADKERTGSKKEVDAPPSRIRQISRNSDHPNPTKKTQMTSNEAIQKLNSDRQHVEDVFRGTGCTMLLPGALAAVNRGAPHDEIAQLAFYMAAGQIAGKDFGPIFRGEYAEVGDLLEMNIDEYCRVRCSEENCEYFPDSNVGSDGPDVSMAYREEYRQVTQASQHSGGVSMTMSENEYVNVRLLEDGKPTVDFDAK